MLKAALGLGETREGGEQYPPGKIMDRWQVVTLIVVLSAAVLTYWMHWAFRERE